MFEDDSRETPVYCQVQKFYVRGPTGDEKQVQLRVLVDFSAPLSKVCKQVLIVQVSDDEDPFFFFSLHLTENDYGRLKSLQGLLVDFVNFPGQVARLLEQCRDDDDRSSRFLLLLEEESTGGTFLKIVETNNFKHLCHLTLQLQPGTDSDLKKVMLKKIKNLKDIKMRCENVISELECQVKDLKKTEESLSTELKEAGWKWKEEKELMEKEFEKQLSSESEKFRKAQLDWTIKSQREKCEYEEKLQTQLKEKDAELSRLKLENQILSEKRTSSDTAIAELSRKIDSFEKENASLRTDLVVSRKACSKLECEVHEKERLVQSLKTRLAVSEQENKDKVLLLDKQQELLEMAKNEKRHFEDTLNEKEKQLQRKITSIHSITEELVKANEIIAKLKREIESLEAKVQTRTCIALEQEKAIDALKKSVQTFQEDIDLLQKQLKISQESESTHKQSLTDLQVQIDSLNKKVKDDERIIEWLNRRLNSTSPPHSSSTPYSSRPFFPAAAPNAVTTLDLHQVPEDSVENKSPNIPESLSINKEESVPKVSQEKTTETTSASVPIKPRSKAVGFRRLSPGQTSTISSSYFLK